MRTEQQLKPRVGRSTGQGAGGNSWSEGSQRKEATGRWGSGQARRPKIKRTDNQLRHSRATRLGSGEASAVDSGGVGEVGMRVSGSHSDPGRPSVLPTATVRDAPEKGIREPRTRATGWVVPVAMRGRRDQGVEWRHSTKEDS